MRCPRTGSGRVRCPRHGSDFADGELMLPMQGCCGENVEEPMRSASFRVVVAKRMVQSCGQLERNFEVDRLLEKLGEISCGRVAAIGQAPVRALAPTLGRSAIKASRSEMPSSQPTSANASPSNADESAWRAASKSRAFGESVPPSTPRPPVRQTPKQTIRGPASRERALAGTNRASRPLDR